MRHQFHRWSGIDLPQTGESKVGGEIVPQFKAALDIHRNQPGERWLSGQTHILEMDQGIFRRARRFSRRHSASSNWITGIDMQQSNVGSQWEEAADDTENGRMVAENTPVEREKGDVLLSD